jgi:hypothetical protein
LLRNHTVNTNPRQRWLAVVLFAIAMAWAEAAVVLDLRTLTHRLDPYQPDPLPLVGNLGQAEMIREMATLMMLAAVGWLAGRDRRTRAAYFLVAFGVWDIFYYVFLRPLTGWPRSIFDWDVLFLVPLPWWGPVLAPTSIAALMIVWGTLTTQCDRRGPIPGTHGQAWAMSLAGAVLALYVFMADAIGVVSQGAEAVRAVLPIEFNWLLFGVAWLLMAAPVATLAWESLIGRRSPATELAPN